MKKSSVARLSVLLVGICLITFITLWTYYPTLNNNFVWDSHTYLGTYWYWLSKFHIYHITWMLLSLEVTNWHPLTWLSWSIDYQLMGGLVPWGFHLSSNILHTLNSLLVFVLMLVVFGLNQPISKGYPFRSDNNALIAALLATLFFAVHPQHVESVAWVAERKDLLCQFFLLLSMLAYVKYVSCDKELKSRWYRRTLGLFAMALLSKPMAVTFPAVLLLLDVYPLRRTSFVQSVNHAIEQRSPYLLLREKLPFFLLSILVVLITIFAQQGAFGHISIPFYSRALNAFNSIIFYLNKLLIPVNLTAHYPFLVNEGASITWEAYIPVISVIGLTLATLFAWAKGRPSWLIAWLFYLVTLSPVLGLIQVGQQGAADRYTYLPTLPAYFLAGAGILFLLNKFRASKQIFVILAIIPLVFLLANKTRQQIPVWETDETLWTHTVNIYPENRFARLNLALNYYIYQDYNKAIFHFERARELKPDDTVSLSWLALANLHLGQYQNAINFHIQLGQAATSENTNKVEQFCIQYNIGWAFAQLGMLMESRELLGRVHPNSDLGEDASTWLSWLANMQQNENDVPSQDSLPGFCEDLLTSK